MAQQSEILIFRTNIVQIFPDCMISKALNSITGITQWTIDTEDIDCVLRIVTPTLSPEMIVTIINSLGYECSDLE